jgi:hypothetical protein
MMRLIVPALLFSTISSGALAATIEPPKKHLLIHRTELGARLHCPNDTIVWASTASHTLYLPGDNHYGHTHGGYACKLEARARGYRGPTSHA